MADVDSEDDDDNDVQDLREVVSQCNFSHSANGRPTSQALLHDLYQAGIDVIRKDWLQLPSEYMRPLRMCAVNQFVHCLDKLDSRYLSHGPEYVLVGTGTSMPKHFHMWIYCMHQVSFRIFLMHC
jgi:hypothetical protein